MEGGDRVSSRVLAGMVDLWLTKSLGEGDDSERVVVGAAVRW